MNSGESISLLNRLILPDVEMKSYHNPREYLKWFLEKSYNFFIPEEQFDFANVQYYSFNNNSPVNFINGRLTGIPCLFSTKGLSKDRSLKSRDILAFVAARAWVLDLPSKDLRDVEKREKLFLSFYEINFSKEEIGRILNAYDEKNNQTL